MVKRSLLAALAVGICILAAVLWWAVRQDGPPEWVVWHTADLAGEPAWGEPERIALEGKRVSLYLEDQVVWQSEADEPVQDVLWCDIDHDSRRELMLLCWRQGRYGQSRPFWEEETQEEDWTQHIFIYDWTGEEVKPIWMASDLGVEVEKWSFTPESRLTLEERSGRVSAWDWQSWGLSALSPRPETAELTVAALGDNLIHRPIYDYALRKLDGNFDHLFAGMAEELARYDVTCLHQETIYVDRRQDYSDYPTFGTPVEVGEAVIRAGFDIVSCASNHALDKGTEAIGLTTQLYRRAGVLCPGIQPVEDGAYQPYLLLERKGITCAVLSYTQMTNGHALPEEAPYVLHTLADEDLVRRDLTAAAEAADFVLVFVHWGTEYAAEPNETQRHWAQVFADCGADVVLGTHPHVLQPTDWVTGADGHKTLVYYSLGNYISAQTDEACRRGGMAYFTLSRAGDQCAVTDWGMKTVLTRQENGLYSTVLEENGAEP